VKVIRAFDDCSYDAVNPWPRPFSRRTRFIVVLTGSK
jgi:hypothetical protein